MKKVISVVLALVMIFTMSAFAFAAESEDDYSQYPLILVPGYSSTRLYYEENGEKVMAWEGVDLRMGTYLLEDIVEVGMSFGALAAGDAEKIARVVGKNFVECYKTIACDKNGKSVYDLKRLHTTPEECCAANLGELQYEKEIMGHMAEYLDGGLENVFNFSSDFRMGAVECATQLYEFIDDVLEYTGAEKVNIFAVSHGGQVTGTYLSLYAKEGDPHENKVNNVVLTVPALGGAGFAYDALNGGVTLDVANIVKFVEHSNLIEENYEWLVQAQVLGFLDDIVAELLPYVYQVIGYWGSMWDFVPLDYYDDLKEKFFDPAESADLIAQSDYMHYEIMTKYKENFASCEKAGANISIIAGYNGKIVTGLQDDSDAIITTKGATGATTAPLGKRFADGYVQKVDTGFYQVSPSMTVDASTGYLPLRTWYVENLFHGMTYKDPYTAELMTKLLLTDEIKDVNSCEEYPQFHASTNSTNAVFAAFNKSKEGFLSSKDTTLVVTNISQKYDLKLLGVSAQGADLMFSGLTTKVLAPGESVEIKLIGSVPNVSLKNIDVIVDYYLVDSVTPVGERVFNFTVMNGDPVKYNPNRPLVDASEKNGATDFVDDETQGILNTVGVMPMLKIIYNIVMPIVELIKKMIESFQSI